MGIQTMAGGGQACPTCGHGAQQPLTGPRRLDRAERAAGLAYARAWRVRNKPHFDALYGPDAVEGGRDAG